MKYSDVHSLSSFLASVIYAKLLSSFRGNATRWLLYRADRDNSVCMCTVSCSECNLHVASLSLFLSVRRELWYCRYEISYLCSASKWHARMKFQESWGRALHCGRLVDDLFFRPRNKFRNHFSYINFLSGNFLEQERCLISFSILRGLDLSGSSQF